MSTVELIPEFYSRNIAHAPQEGSFAQPSWYVGPQLRFGLRWQAAVNQRQAVGEKSGQIKQGAAYVRDMEASWVNGTQMETADDPRCCSHYKTSLSHIVAGTLYWWVLKHVRAHWWY